MKFQHTTSLAIQPGIQRRTQSAASGASMIVIPGQSTNFSITLQQIVMSWTGLSAAGQINIVGSVSDPNPFVVYQSVPSGQVVVPFYDEVYQLGTYGLRAVNNSTGGTYLVTAFYTQLTP